jgi:AbrB family transcriptional regulator (stage V sporulation protein T)
LKEASVLKATGIVRRIDELGRIVIPKEIRRTLRIREGDPLEIFTDREGEVILKKYSPIGEMGDIARQFAESLYRIVGHVALISDRDAILAAAGSRSKDYIDKPLSASMEQTMNDRRSVHVSSGGEKTIAVIADDTDGGFACQVIVPILAEGEVIGTVMLVDKEPGSAMGEAELKVVQTAANFIGRQMES